MKYLSPRLSILKQEYVLVQAFKKTVSCIRSHNWFANVLELDLATIDYPSFFETLERRIKHPSQWTSQAARLVPAPKSGQWWINKSDEWEPRPDDKRKPTDAKLRPLAHIPLVDQVVATAIMMCLADHIETLQGDPQLDVRKPANRKKVVSYGNRLFCDGPPATGGSQLRHRWGSSKLYRSYYVDYRMFVSRPEIVAAQIGERSNTKIVIVQADLSKFYDRVRPAMLHAALRRHFTDSKHVEFLDFAERVLSWKWDGRDKSAACSMTDIADFESLALPQGLVSSGFFANIMLLDFDKSMRDAFNTTIANGIILHDGARYVDDLRFVVEVPNAFEMKDVEGACQKWLRGTLRKTAPGLTANDKKTRAVAVHDSQRVMVFQSRRMRRIQEAVSGGFDAAGGTQLLASLEGLFNTVGQFVEADENGTRWPLKAVPDVRDETVARFVAGRYRSTYRSLRPLLEDDIIDVPDPDSSDDDDEPARSVSAVLTKDELDRQSQAFGLRLIEEWICNPGNVRLLRVGLDLFPDSSVLESVIKLLKPRIESSSDVRGIRSVAVYCLAELFGAAATETGLVPDPEHLPGGVDLQQYQDVLRDYARDLMAKQWDTLPWFCQQQILLFVAASSSVGFNVKKAGKAPETADHASILAFLQGQPESNLERWTTSAVLARQSYLDPDAASRLIVPQLTAERIESLAKLAPTVAEELLGANRRLRRLADKAVLNRLSLPQRLAPAATVEFELPLVNESRRWDCRLRNEQSLVTFALRWLEERERAGHSLPPAVIRVSFSNGQFQSLTVGDRIKNPLFQAPSWCKAKDEWRFELGMVLRFIIIGQSDPTENPAHPSWREYQQCYRPPSWHWKVRRYSLFNGRDRLGPEWLPISSWMESFLTALLHWPGALLPPQPFKKLRTISQAKALCKEYANELASTRGEASRLLMLSVTPRSTWNSKTPATKPLRVCIAQLAVPEFRDGRATGAFGRHDPEFNAPATRHQYRRHLTAMLAGIDQMLRVRATHRQDSGLDFLLLPELAVHPDDVRSRLLPFVRKHRCWVFTGLTYHRCHKDGPLVNSGLWIVPEASPQNGILYRLYEQGKQHLAPEEESMLRGVVKEHRPCQWLLRWKWSSNEADRPLILSGSICYDATDLALAADLKRRTDIYAIPALNRDVGTFDRMTDALHYHMYQMIILANHAHFGGSNAYVPYREHFHKQVFHLHGQDGAILAFFDISNPGELINRGNTASEARTNRLWKTPPADWQPPKQ